MLSSTRRCLPPRISSSLASVHVNPQNQRRHQIQSHPHLQSRVENELLKGLSQRQQYRKYHNQSNLYEQQKKLFSTWKQETKNGLYLPSSSSISSSTMTTTTTLNSTSLESNPSTQIVSRDYTTTNSSPYEFSPSPLYSSSLSSSLSMITPAKRKLTFAEEYSIQPPPTRITTLPTGLRVATETTSYGQTATVGVWIDAGSRYEDEQNNGAAHFLEHMAFKGTSKRAMYDIEVGIENMGAHLNAYTSREQTVYYAKVFKNDIEKALDVLSDILLNSLFEVKAVDRERDVILREMEEVNKQKEEVIMDYLHEVAYQGTGLGRTILGPEENIRSLTRDDLKEYIRRHYTASRVVIAGVGCVDHNQLCDLADKYFGKLPPTPMNADGTYKIHGMDPARFTGSDKRVHIPNMIPNDGDNSLGGINLSQGGMAGKSILDSLNNSGSEIDPQSIEQMNELQRMQKGFENNPVMNEPAHIAMAFEGTAWTSELSFPLMLLQGIVGAWDRTSVQGKNVGTSLGQKCGEKDLCHSFFTFNTCYKDTGLFGIYAVVPPETVRDFTFTMMEELVRLTENITEEELAKAKTHLKATTLLQLDSFSHICEDMGRQILTYGRRMTPLEIFARIDAVTVEDVRDTAKILILNEDHCMAAIGSLENLPDYDEIRGKSF